MTRIAFLLLLALASHTAIADDSDRFVGIWATGGVARGGPALYLYPDGKAYFHAMCGSAPGNWKQVKGENKIEVTLESDGTKDRIELQLDKRGWLIRIGYSPKKDKLEESIASEALQELEKYDKKLSDEP